MGGVAKLFGIGQDTAPTITPAATIDPNQKTAIDLARERRLLEQRALLNDRNTLVIAPTASTTAANGLYIPNPNA